MTDLAEVTTAEVRCAVPSADGVDLALVGRLADNFVELMRTFVRARQAIMQAAQHDVEWTSQMVLRTLKNHGPMRAGAIAEALQADPSTISRQVAAVVKDGLVERQADPEDGRASLLVLTGRADEVLADYDRIRAGYYAELLADWEHEDIEAFADMLQRFGTAYQAKGDTWIADKIAPATRRSRSND